MQHTLTALLVCLTLCLPFTATAQEQSDLGDNFEQCILNGQAWNVCEETHIRAVLPENERSEEPPALVLPELPEYKVRGRLGARGIWVPSPSELLLRDYFSVSPSPGSRNYWGQVPMHDRI